MKHRPIHLLSPTCFGLRPSSGSLYLAWLKLYIYVLIGYVVVWQHVLGVACVFCAVQNETHVNYSAKFKPSKFNE
jgi:hypothetical protein